MLTPFVLQRRTTIKPVNRNPSHFSGKPSVARTDVIMIAFRTVAVYLFGPLCTNSAISVKLLYCCSMGFLGNTHK